MLRKGKLTNPVSNMDRVENIVRDSIDHDQVQFEKRKTILDVLEDVMNDLNMQLTIMQQLRTTTNGIIVK